MSIFQNLEILCKNNLKVTYSQQQTKRSETGNYYCVFILDQIRAAFFLQCCQRLSLLCLRNKPPVKILQVTQCHSDRIEPKWSTNTGGMRECLRLCVHMWKLNKAHCFPILVLRFLLSLPRKRVYIFMKSVPCCQIESNDQKRYPKTSKAQHFKTSC